MNCEVCGLPCGGPIGGNPKVFHLACIMKITTHLRERSDDKRTSKRIDSAGNEGHSQVNENISRCDNS